MGPQIAVQAGRKVRWPLPGQPWYKGQGPFRHYLLLGCVLAVCAHFLHRKKKTGQAETSSHMYMAGTDPALWSTVVVVDPGSRRRVQPGIASPTSEPCQRQGTIDIPSTPNLSRLSASSNFDSPSVSWVTRGRERERERGLHVACHHGFSLAGR